MLEGKTCSICEAAAEASVSSPVTHYFCGWCFHTITVPLAMHACDRDFAVLVGLARAFHHRGNCGGLPAPEVDQRWAVMSKCGDDEGPAQIIGGT